MSSHSFLNHIFWNTFTYCTVGALLRFWNYTCISDFPSYPWNVLATCPFIILIISFLFAIGLCMVLFHIVICLNKVTKTSVTDNNNIWFYDSISAYDKTIIPFILLLLIFFFIYIKPEVGRSVNKEDFFKNARQTNIR